MIAVVSVASCQGCDWTATGTPTDVDKAAEKHVRPGHSTVASSTPKEKP